MIKTNNFLTRHKTRNIEYAILFVVLLCLAFPIFKLHYLITLDGPTHLYNAVIHKRLLMGDALSNMIYEVNPRIVSNYTTHCVMLMLVAIFKPVLALKLFHFILITMFLLGFRSWNYHRNKFSYLLILPLIYSQIFENGFYSFLFGLSLLFFLLGFVERKNDRNLRFYILVFAFLFIIYFSHILVFFISGLLLISLEIMRIRKLNKDLFKSLLYLFLAALPFIVLSLYFTLQRDGVNTYLDSAELLRNLNQLSSWKIFLGIIQYSFQIFILLLLIILVFDFVKYKRFNLSYLGLGLMISLICFFFFPDSTTYAGVFSVRFEFVFWLLFLALVSRSSLLKRLQLPIYLIAFSLFIFKLNAQLKDWKSLDRRAELMLKNVQDLNGKYPVIPLFAGESWHEYHISNLIGAEKNIVVLENNETRNDYFPLRYKEPLENLYVLNRKFELPNWNKVYLLKLGKASFFQESDSLNFYGSENDSINEFVRLQAFPK